MKITLLVILAALCALSAEPQTAGQPLKLLTDKAASPEPVATLYQWENPNIVVGNLNLESRPTIMQIGLEGRAVTLKFNSQQPTPHETVITSDFEPQVVKTDKGWEIRFLPSDS